MKIKPSSTDGANHKATNSEYEQIKASVNSVLHPWRNELASVSHQLCLPSSIHFMIFM